MSEKKKPRCSICGKSNVTLHWNRFYGWICLDCFYKYYEVGD